jgi:hypothetical protein
VQTGKWSETENSQEDVLTTETTMSASWIELDGGNSEGSIINNSLVIAKCKVLDKRQEIEGGKIDEGGAPFTYFTVTVEEIYAYDENRIQTLQDDLKGSSHKIEVRLTGGEVNGQEQAFRDSPLLLVDEEYVLFLDKELDYKYYVPVGERLGIAKLDDDGILHFTNDEAKSLCKDFEGKKFTDITKILSKIGTAVDDSIKINTEKESIKAVLF